MGLDYCDFQRSELNCVLLIVIKLNMVLRKLKYHEFNSIKKNNNDFLLVKEKIFMNYNYIFF